VQYLQSAEPGASRTAMLARRREEKARELEANAALSRRPPVGLFSEQPQPFWKVASKSKGRSSPADGAEALSIAQSLEALQSDRRWYARPEVYSKVGACRREEPFKLSPNDKRFLGRKLTSGPKKAMRGYPREAGEVSAKVTETVSSLATDLRIQHTPPTSKPRFTDTVLHFQAHDNGLSENSGDGIKFTEPLYSSFSKSGIFEPRDLPPKAEVVRAREGPSAAARGAEIYEAESRQAGPREVRGPMLDGRPASVPSGSRGAVESLGALKPIPTRPTSGCRETISAPSGTSGGLGLTAASAVPLAGGATTLPARSSSAQPRMSAVLRGGSGIRSGGF